ncbi:NAD(P)/FAD-dependent oxidoreductase [Enterocloster lavalensis]|uniref:NAD(P)/FAD-dependent oxidoreductase n=1 Tax=Enterocloster lavalensis TaxID=460384 RepID=UPI0023F1C926|nr:NAD(P)/FAD-dependent oxidoreductase [Enterocloster lavalensis]
MRTYAIVGFGTAGYHALKAIRRLDAGGTVDVYTNTGLAPYNPMLTTYYAGGKLSYREMFPFGSLEEIQKTCSFRCICDTVKSVAAGRTVETENGEVRTYDKILIATGASAFAPAIPGLEPERRFFMRTDEDALRLSRALEDKRVKSTVVVGASMVGIKVAELFAKRGIRTVLADLASCMFPLAAYEDVAAEIGRRVEQKGVSLRFGRTIERVELEAGEAEQRPDAACGDAGEQRPGAGCGDAGEQRLGAGCGRVPEPESASPRRPRQIAVMTDGERLEADLVVLCIGTRANIGLADGGIETNRAILVNERMETSAEGIYAAGDCCAGTNIQSGERQIIGLWANANHQGTVAGINMAGGNARFEGNILHNITHFMDMDFIGFGDNRIQGETLVFGSLKQGLYLKAVCRDGRIAGVNILDSYPVSGMIKNYMLRLFQEPESRFPPFQIGMLVKAGLTEEFIERLEAAVHGDQGRAAESENSVPGNGN